MTDITEEEAEALDKQWTHNTPRLKPNGSGFVSRRYARLMGLDDLSMDYLAAKSEATKKSPAQIIGELIREKIAVSLNPIAERRTAFTAASPPFPCFPWPMDVEGFCVAVTCQPIEAPSKHLAFP